MGKYIGHRFVARPELDNTFWTESTVDQKINYPSFHKNYMKAGFMTFCGSLYVVMVKLRSLWLSSEWKVNQGRTRDVGSSTLRVTTLWKWQIEGKAEGAKIWNRAIAEGGPTLELEQTKVSARRKCACTFDCCVCDAAIVWPPLWRHGLRSNFLSDNSNRTGMRRDASWLACLCTFPHATIITTRNVWALIMETFYLNVYKRLRCENRFSCRRDLPGKWLPIKGVKDTIRTLP